MEQGEVTQKGGGEGKRCVAEVTMGACFSTHVGWRCRVQCVSGAGSLCWWRGTGLGCPRLLTSHTTRRPFCG